MEPKEDFYRSFQMRVAALQHQIDALTSTTPSAIEPCLSSISSLSLSVQDAASTASSIPAHDQRTYTQAIKSLQDRLAAKRAALTPRAKFAFTKKTSPRLPPPPPQPQPPENSSASSASASASTAPTPAPAQETSTAPQLPVHPAAAAAAAAAPLTTHAILALASPHTSSLSHTILLPSPSPSPSRPATPTPTLTLKNITHSLLLLPAVTGALHATSLRSCTLLVPYGCGQLRLHACVDVDVYVSRCASRPVVEDVRGARFAPLVLDGDGDGDGDGEGNRGTTTTNRWAEVDDFNSPGAEGSPNWCVMPKDQRVAWGVWKRLCAEARRVGDEIARDGDGDGDGDEERRRRRRRREMEMVEGLLVKAGVRV